MYSSLRRGQIGSKVIALRRSSNVAKFRVKTVKEHPDPVEGKIKGSIPSWISGRLLRVGPGIFEFGNTKYNHWFDGQSLLHSFTINNGKVQYRSRYLHSESFKKNTAANRIVVTEFGTLGYPDPCKTLFQRIMANFQILSPNNEVTDNCNVNLYPIGEDIVVATEVNVIHRIDPGTLDTMERINLSKYVAINTATAHPHVDPDGTVYNLGTAYKGRPHTCVVKLPANGQGNCQDISRGKVICSIPGKRGVYPSYHHSFGMSENYIIMTEQPAYLNILNYLGSSMFGKAGGKMQVVVTDKDEKVYFHVVEKNSGEEHAIQYIADCFFTFHHINTFEDNGNIIVDLCCTMDEGYYNFGYIDGSWSSIPNESNNSVRRYVLPLNTATKPPGENLVELNYTNATAVLQADGCVKCTHEMLSPIGFDFPRINYSACNGKKYQFVYGVAGLEKLLKLDVRKKTVKQWMENSCFPSEPVFVPHPSAKNEDDGVILSAVIHSDPEQNPFLLILDSKTMNEIGRAEFEEVKFHKDLHGIFHIC